MKFTEKIHLPLQAIIILGALVLAGCGLGDDTEDTPCDDALSCTCYYRCVSTSSWAAKGRTTGMTECSCIQFGTGQCASTGTGLKLQESLCDPAITSAPDWYVACEEGQFECARDECIFDDYVCNGILDCSNGEDEKGCENSDYRECTEDEWACADGWCIDKRSVCDEYYEDCLGGEDEDSTFCETWDWVDWDAIDPEDNYDGKCRDDNDCPSLNCWYCSARTGTCSEQLCYPSPEQLEGMVIDEDMECFDEYYYPKYDCTAQLDDPCAICDVSESPFECKIPRCKDNSDCQCRVCEDGSSAICMSNGECKCYLK